jgi:hypothetical protein
VGVALKKLHDRRAAITLPWPTSGAREDDELLGRSGHRDVAVDCSFDTLAWRPYRTWAAVHLRALHEQRTGEISGR